MRPARARHDGESSASGPWKREIYSLAYLAGADRPPVRRAEFSSGLRKRVSLQEQDKIPGLPGIFRRQVGQVRGGRECVLPREALCRRTGRASRGNLGHRGQPGAWYRTECRSRNPSAGELSAGRSGRSGKPLRSGNCRTRRHYGQPDRTERYGPAGSAGM